MDELTAFFRSRLAEVESIAKRRSGAIISDLMLADIQADRALLAKYEIAKALLPGKYKLGYCEAIEEVIAIRAARFSDHPDYRAEWAV